MTTDPDAPQQPDDRFAGAYDALADDLAVVLDLTAGTADATGPAAYAALTADLATVLHIDTGLVLQG